MSAAEKYTWHPEYEKSRQGRDKKEVFKALKNWKKGVLAEDKQVLNASAKNVAMAMSIIYFNDETGQCNPSVESLSYDVGLSHRSTQEAIRALVEAGWISVTPRTNGSNQYVLRRIRFSRSGDLAHRPANDDEPVRQIAPHPCEVSHPTPAESRTPPLREIAPKRRREPKGERKRESFSSAGATATRRKTLLPDDFTLTDERRAMAIECGVLLSDTDQAFSHFKSHATKTARVSFDWNEELRSWFFNRVSMNKRWEVESKARVELQISRPKRRMAI